MSNIQQVVKLILLCCGVILAIPACSSHSAQLLNSPPPSQPVALSTDNLVPIPLVNGQPTNYSIYLKNLSPINISGLTLSIHNQNVSTNNTQSANWGSVDHILLDTNTCSNIVAGSSCKINITAESPGVAMVIGKLNGQEVVSATASMYPITVVRSGDLSQALVLANYPNTLVLQPNKGDATQNSYFGSVSLSVVNQYSDAIDVTNLFSDLPTNVSWQPINCPNPLPFAGVCQVRLSYSGPAIDSNIRVNLIPHGILNGTSIPEQQSNGTILITQAKIANLSVSYPSIDLSGYEPTKDTTTGYITNNGIESANVSSIQINNNVFSVTQNGCLGTLAAGATCQYTITANVGQLSDTASGSYSSGLNIVYNNGIANTQINAQLKYSYIKVIPTSLGISINGVTNLTDVIESGTVTLTNNSNVALTNISLPVLSGYTNGVQITDPDNCSTQTIYPGGSCNFQINYTPTGSNINQVVTIGGISATYVDLVSHNTETALFNDQYVVNLTTGDAAQLTINPLTLTPSLDWTNSTSYSESVLVINQGGSTVTNITKNIINPEYGSLSVSGCDGQLSIGESCILTVNGTYSSNESLTYSSNGVITLNYVDTTSTSNTQAINVGIQVRMKPVVLPGLSISGTLPSSMYGGSLDTQSILLTLTNNTIATNDGDATIEIAESSLYNNIGTHLSGVIHTNGLVNPCDISESNITLSGGQSCNVDLVITANGDGAQQATIAPTYQYYSYNNLSTTPNLATASGSQLSTLSGLINVQARNASLSLAFYNESSATEPISSLSVEQSGSQTLVGTAVLKISNTGTTALTSITMPSIHGFTFVPDTNCATLAVGESCNVGVILSSTSPIPLTVISTNSANIVNFTYSNHLGSHSGSSNLPSLLYQVVAPNQPQINISESISGCGGNVNNITQVCNLNPGNSGAGTVGGYRFIVTYTNISESVAANNFTVVPPVNGVATGYSTQPINNCNGVTLATHNGSCTVEYQLIASATNGSVSNGLTLGSYTYNYGQGNILSSVFSVSNTTTITANIIQPSLALSLSLSSMQVSESAVASAVISNWYASAIPASVSVTSSTPATVAGIMASCNSSGASGATCTGTLTGLAAGTTGISANLTAPNGATISPSLSPLTLTVTPQTFFRAYFPSGCIVRNLGAGVTGTCQCIRDSRTDKIWTVLGPYNATLGASWNLWTTGGSSLNTYNSQARCGLTGGWHLPSASTSGTSFMSPTYPGGDWSAIAIDAGMNGTAYSIGAWMNNNGFQVSTAVSTWFWGGYAPNTDFALLVRMSNGSSNIAMKTVGYNVLMVHD